MNVSVIIATYGEDSWRYLGYERALPSVDVGVLETINTHCRECSIAEARNQGAAAAIGDWLCFLDADDELAPGYLDAMERAFEQVGDGPVLLTPAVQTLRKNGSITGPPKFFDRGFPLSEDNWLVVGTLIQRDLFMQVGGFSDYPHGFEDFSLWNKAWQAGAKIVKVPDAIYRYWINPRSKHKMGWRDRKWQVATHQRVVKELAEWGRERGFAPRS